MEEVKISSENLKNKQPSNIEAEQALLGSILVNNDIIDEVATTINPNVFYEIGIAHTLGKEVILLTQNSDDVPFDLRHLRYIRYLNNEQGCEQLSEEISSRLQTILSR